MKRIVFVLSLFFTGFSVTAQDRKPDLWLLAVGINRYYQVAREQHLRFAKQNIKAIVDGFSRQRGKAFNTIHVLRVLDNTELPPVRKNIAESLSFLKQAKEGDVTVFYFSGHGDIDKADGAYYLLPSDIGFKPDDTMDFSTAISMDMIASNLNGGAANIIFIESCYSAMAIKKLRGESTIIFASSLEDEESYEAPLLVHGAFNLAVSEALSGKAAVNGVITAESLSGYISGKVAALGREGRIPEGKQHPAAYIPEGLRGFVLGVFDERRK